MVQKVFKHKMDELKGLINEEIWSAPSAFMAADPYEKVLLAVSGGMDSMCLAHLYLQTYGVNSFAIAHCNFNLRAEEGDADTALVEDWAGTYGVKLHVERFDTVAFAEANGLSIEMAARELRYRWFEELCLAHGYKAVVTAHHADDNAETMLLNMVRGTGIKGMTGMKTMASLPYGDTQLKLLRPMLGFTRKQIEGYVLRYRIPYRDDSSNMSVEYRRNRLRHEVIPVFRKMNPSFVTTLNREMSYLSDVADIVDQWCNSVAPSICIPTSGTCDSDGQSIIKVSIPGLLSHKHWRYLLYHILEPYGFNAAALAALENLLLSDRTISGKRFTSATHVLQTERDELIVSPSSDEQASPDEVQIFQAGLYLLNDTAFSVELLPWTADMPKRQPEGTMVFDAGKLDFPFICRSWKQGDWIVPLGMKGKKKLSDIFTDLKWSSLQKAKAVVVAADQEQHVAALLGARMDERYKIDDQTDMAIRITIR